MSYRNPETKDLTHPVFEAIWNTIKSWDINVPAEYKGYCGASGNHVTAILDAIRPFIVADTALREYGDAEYQRGINSINSLVEVMDQGKIKQEARRAALQEAAKVIESCAGPSAKDLANKVRALAPSDGKGEGE